jgi:hypothetical protein
VSKGADEFNFPEAGHPKSSKRPTGFFSQLSSRTLPRFSEKKPTQLQD